MSILALVRVDKLACNQIRKAVKELRNQYDQADGCRIDSYDVRVKQQDVGTEQGVQCIEADLPGAVDQ